ncbi:hypothetical protein D9758_017162 [Tetrapyrgos nigripes]|uniref:Uncharacterized protein n=1 Tax=Tetrapyrgos nigripes TaxID=182062 RepID=A0A8H5AUV4_9AGAR|nr:hypothetical protein D9758_019065 [Tetrapyrgos nigripes]KAF5329131.1 hypothetical protein D9758_017162 [Tetrapyrgos nigripes]
MVLASLRSSLSNGYSGNTAPNDSSNVKPKPTYSKPNSNITALAGTATPTSTSTKSTTKAPASTKTHTHTSTPISHQPSTLSSFSLLRRGVFSSWNSPITFVPNPNQLRRVIWL